MDGGDCRMSVHLNEHFNIVIDKTQKQQNIHLLNCNEINNKHVFQINSNVNNY